MTRAFPTRRRGDTFDHLVESASTGADIAPGAPADLRELASLATSLAQVPAPQPRAAFSADLRERLMTAAATELGQPKTAAVRDKLTVRGLGATTPKQRSQRRLTVAIAALAVIGGTTGTAIASQNALPGDMLYPVKRAIENIHTSISQGDESKGKTLIADANTRLSEADTLSARRQASDAGEISTTLTSFSQQAQHASTLLIEDYQTHHDPASITALHQFTARSITQLTQISANVPPTVHAALTQATQTLISIDQQAGQLCPSCGNLGITQLPSSLLTATGETLNQLAGTVGAQPGTTDSAGQPGTTLPKITLPKVPANLPPAIAPSASPSSSTPKVSTSRGASTTPTTSTSHSSTSPTKGSQTKPSPSPTSTPGTLGDTVGKATNGVGDLVGSVVRGLLGGG